MTARSDAQSIVMLALNLRQDSMRSDSARQRLMAYVQPRTRRQESSTPDVANIMGGSAMGTHARTRRAGGVCVEHTCLLQRLAYPITPTVWSRSEKNLTSTSVCNTPSTAAVMAAGLLPWLRQRMTACRGDPGRQGRNSSDGPPHVVQRASGMPTQACPGPPKRGTHPLWMKGYRWMVSK